MESGAVVTYNDPRRFGFMVLMQANELTTHKLFAGMGVEPLGNEFHAGVLAERGAGRSVDLKALLLDQRTVAGLGNIYVCEALHRAGLSPTRKASSLADRRSQPTERAARLVPIIRQVLDEAIIAGGSTLRDFAKADGSLGYFQHSFQVYGREGEPCQKADCKGVIQRIVQSGRSTFYCKVCQR
jgi:formamidopyrimidine-DNA glycosylase